MEARQDGDRVQWQASPGGLVQTLGKLLGPEGVWIGWAGLPGEWDVEAELERQAVPLDHRAVAVPLSQQEYEDYYLGFANQVIWPLFHDLHPYCRFRPTYWDAYEVVADRFASIAAGEAGPMDIVWVHDYQLIGAGQRLRQRGFDGPMGFFLHVPFPGSDIFRRFPWHVDLLKSFAAYDRIGFQSMHDARNFVRCMAAVGVGDKVVEQDDGWLMTIDGRTVEVGAYPIGIDSAGVQARAESPVVQRRVERLARHKQVTYVLGVERLDYTKGVPERLHAFGGALRKYPELRGKVSLIQHVDPSRQHIDQYARLRREIEQLVGRINGEFGSLGWTPVHYSYAHADFDEVLALYRVSDVALVTPVRDGMNLVAKEFCAAHTDEDGVLVLSEFTGAAQQLGAEAILVNPHDVEGTADAIRQACFMPAAERQRRMRALRSIVHRECVQKWAREFLDGLGTDRRPVVVRADIVP